MSLLGKVAAFARSPKGRQLTEQGKSYAAKPENRRKLQQLQARLTKKR